MKGFFVLNLPGPTPADMRSLPFQRITRPVFPLDEGLSDPAIDVFTSNVPRCLVDSVTGVRAARRIAGKIGWGVA
jgi:hypothetical protein